MAKQGLGSFSRRTKRWLLIGAGAVAVYSLAGFALVPWVIEKQIPRIGQDMLQRQASVADVRFNPYTLRMVMQGLNLAEADGAPLASVDELRVEMQWRSIVRRAWSFANIGITAPKVHLEIAPDGSLNFKRLIDSIPSDPDPKPKDEDASLPRLVVEHFSVAQGSVSLQDHKVGYSNSFDPIDFSLQHFSTLPERDGHYSFRSELASGGALVWTGDMSVNPIRGVGEFRVENGSLPEPSVYLKPYTSARIHTGHFNASLPYQFTYDDGKLDATLAGIDLRLQGLVVSAEDKPGQPPAVGKIEDIKLKLDLTASQTQEATQMRLINAGLAINGVALEEGKSAPFKLAQLGFENGQLDLVAREASIARVFAEDAALAVTRKANGDIDLVQFLERFAALAQESGTVGTPAEPAKPEQNTAPEQAAASEAAEPAPPWKAKVDRIELRQLGARLADQGTGVAINIEDMNVTVEEAGSDLTHPVKFDVALRVKEGGNLAVKGDVVPNTAVVKADVNVDKFQLQSLQPLVSQYVKLTLGGDISAKGKLVTGSGTAKAPALRYDGSFDLARMSLDESNGERFAGWKSVAADTLSVTVSPNNLDIPELRIVEPQAILFIEEDRSFNAVRLLVEAPLKQGAPAPGRNATAEKEAAAKAVKPAAKQTVNQAANTEPAEDPFPTQIRRVRLQKAKLDFTDLSLVPQFGAKIYDLNGVITGLSSKPGTRSQVELDGRVDDFGLARIRGSLNPFVIAENTNLDLQFKNLEMTSVSPYSMKFAGYKIAEGKLSLDLRYRVRDKQLEATNNIVLDNFTLGEKIESPDAFNLPLELAIAILKDSDGRIDLDLPISGDLDDPQFSYGAIVWKAIGNLITRVVTAPFRALGALLGGGGEDLESIDFDPGSDRLLPPEREKLLKIAEILSKRPQLKLVVPAQYAEAADGAALRVRAVRVEIGNRAGIKTPEGEVVGPLPLSDGKVRKALRELYTQRFGEAEYKKVVADAQAREATNAADAKAKLSMGSRLSNFASGEPQLTQPGEFYRSLQQRLVDEHPLPKEALAALATGRAEMVMRTFQEAGVAEGAVVVGETEAVEVEPEKMVPVKLGLAAK